MSLGIQDLGRTLKQVKSSGVSSSAKACLFMAYAKVTFSICKYCVSQFQITYSQSKSKLKYVVVCADLHFMLQHIEIKVGTYN